MEQVEIVKKMFKEGYGAGTIARYLKCGTSRVEKIMKENNLKRSREESIKARNKVASASKVLRFK